MTPASTATGRPADQFQLDKLVVDFLALLNQLRSQPVQLFRAELQRQFDQFLRLQQSRTTVGAGLSSDRMTTAVDRGKHAERLHRLLFAKSFESVLTAAEQLHFEPLLSATRDPYEYPTLASASLVERTYFELLLLCDWHSLLERQLATEPTQQRLLHLFERGCEFLRRAQLPGPDCARLLCTLLTPIWRLTLDSTAELDDRSTQAQLRQIRPLLEQAQQLSEQLGCAAEPVPVAGWAGLLLDRLLECILDRSLLDPKTLDPHPPALLGLLAEFGAFPAQLLGRIDGLHKRVNEKLVWTQAIIRRNLPDMPAAELARRYLPVGCDVDLQLKSDQYTSDLVGGRQPGYERLIQIYIQDEQLSSQFLPDFWSQLPLDVCAYTHIQTQLVQQLVRQPQPELRQKLRQLSAQPLHPQVRAERLAQFLQLGGLQTVPVEPLPYAQLRLCLNRMLAATEADVHCRTLLSFVYSDSLGLLQFLLDRCLGPNRGLIALVCKMLAGPLRPLCNHRPQEQPPDTLLFALCMHRQRSACQEEFGRLVELVSGFLAESKPARAVNAGPEPPLSTEEQLFRSCLLGELFRSTQAAGRTLCLMELALRSSLKAKAAAGWLLFSQQTELVCALHFLRQLGRYVGEDIQSRQQWTTLMQLIQANFLPQSDRRLLAEWSAFQPSESLPVLAELLQKLGSSDCDQVPPGCPPPGPSSQPEINGFA